MSPSSFPNHPKLTDALRAVLEEIAAGKTNAQIAAERHVSLRTVNNQVHEILETLDLPNRSRAAAAVYAVKHGLVPEVFCPWCMTP